MADPGTTFRRAYQAVLDRTPPASGWDEIDTSPAPARRRGRRRRSVPRWLPAPAAALLLLAVLAGAAMLGLDGEPAATTVATAPAAAAPPATAPPTTPANFVTLDQPARALTPRLVEASSELAGHEARHLVDGTPQAWNDDSLRGEGAVLTFSLPDQPTIHEIVIHNLDDPARFARNFRIARLAVSVDGVEVLQRDLPDEPGPHRVPIGRPGASLAIHVLATHPAEVFGGSPPFEELAVAEVELFGWPAG